MATRETKAGSEEGRVYARVDNRLLHGQIVQFWIGHLKIEHLIVADDEVARNEAMMTIYRLAMPRAVELTITPLEPLAKELESRKSARTMVLMKDIDDAVRALARGADFKRITLGNIHASADRARVTNSVYLSQEDIKKLAKMTKQGVEVEIQTFPGEKLRLEVEGEGAVRWSKS